MLPLVHFVCVNIIYQSVGFLCIRTSSLLNAQCSHQSIVTATRSRFELIPCLSIPELTAMTSAADSCDVINTQKPMMAKMLPSWCYTELLKDTSYYLKLFLFMISDFYIRSIPLITFLSLIPCDEIGEICLNRVITFCFLFGSILVFEFAMNKIMRIKEYASILFVLQIFSVSMFSSFSTLLSSLETLKSDIFFGKSVIFPLFIKEHGIRIVLSIIISIINLSLLSVNGLEEITVVSILSTFYVIFLLLNLLTIVDIVFHLD